MTEMELEVNAILEVSNSAFENMCKGKKNKTTFYTIRVSYDLSPNKCLIYTLQSCLPILIIYLFSFKHKEFDALV